MTSTTQRKSHERHCDAAEVHIRLEAYDKALNELYAARSALHEAEGTARCEYLVALCLLELGHDASGPLQEAMRLFFESNSDVNPDPDKEAFADTLLECIRTLQARITLHEAGSLIAEVRNANGSVALIKEALKKLEDTLKSGRLDEAETAFATGLEAYCQWTMTVGERTEEQQALFAARRVLKRLDESDFELVIIDLLLDTRLARLQALHLALREAHLSQNWLDGMSTSLRLLAGFSLR